MDRAEAADVAQRERFDAVEHKVAQRQQSGGVRNTGEVTCLHSGAIIRTHGIADERDARARLRVRIGIAHQQADARIGIDILRVFRQLADQYHRPRGMIGYAGRHRAEWMAAEFFRNSGQQAVAVPAQLTPALGAYAHAASLSAVSANRLPSAMHMFFSSSVIGRSLVAPATWLAP